MIMNAVEMMTKFEHDCLTFYETLGRETNDQELKALYALLAGTQKQHLAKLAGLRATTGARESESMLIDRADHLVNGCHRLLVGNDLMKTMKNDRDGFDHVVHAEEEMIRLFEGMAKAEQREGTRKLLTMIASDEKEHLQEIEWIYEFIEKPHCYLEWGEFSNLNPL